MGTKLLDEISEILNDIERLNRLHLVGQLP